MASTMLKPRPMPLGTWRHRRDKTADGSGLVRVRDAGSVIRDRDLDAILLMRDA